MNQGDDGKKVIEAHEIKCGVNTECSYTKLTVVLKGDVVDHVARYCQLQQGQTLWAVGSYDDDAVIKFDESVVNLILQILNPSGGAGIDTNSSKGFFDGESDICFNLNDEDCRERGKQFFVDLIKRFVLGRNAAENELTDVTTDYVFSDKMFSGVKEIVDAAKGKNRFHCKLGIVHGDMNYGNIMLDAKDEMSEKDVWFIDFARTRRDIIAHDFNVMLTATFALLFDNELWFDRRLDGDKRYAKRLSKIFPLFISDALFANSDEEPDYLYVAKDRRFSFFYKVFRRIRWAALKDDKMTEDMYILTTALCCLYTFRIFLKYESNIQGAAALLATAYICLEYLKRHKPKGVK